MTAYRLLDLRHGFDLCINIGPCSYAMKHANKRVWLFSQYSPFYELWDSPYGAVTASQTNRSTRECVRAMDQTWLSEAQVLCAASETLARMLREGSGTQARVLPPALPRGFDTAPASYGDYFLAAGPLVDTARIAMLIQSFCQTETPAQLVVMGFEVTREEREHVEYRVSTANRTGEKKAGAITLEINPSYARFRACASAALAFVSLPFRANTLDLFSLVAASAQRPLVTTRDSGEPARLIENELDGYCVAPDETALAHAMDDIFRNKRVAERWGKRLSEKLRDLLPSWDAIATELTG
jgi:hypothetical protein